MNSIIIHGGIAEEVNELFDATFLPCIRVLILSFGIVCHRCGGPGGENCTCWRHKPLNCHAMNDFWDLRYSLVTVVFPFYNGNDDEVDDICFKSLKRRRPPSQDGRSTMCVYNANTNLPNVAAMTRCSICGGRLRYLRDPCCSIFNKSNE